MALTMKLLNNDNALFLLASVAISLVAVIAIVIERSNENEAIAKLQTAQSVCFAKARTTEQFEICKSMKE